MDLLTKLQAPFPADKISWRVGARTSDKTKGIALAYIDARDVMRRFDEVCGVDWQCTYSHVTDKGVVCNIGILIAGEWRWRANGAGETDVEGEKGAMSDAFKRAGVLWGVGRYLYDLPNVWCSLKSDGKYLAETPSLPAWALPEYAPVSDSPALGRLLKLMEGDDPTLIYALSKEDEQGYRQAFGRLNMKQKDACRKMEQEGSMMIIDWAEFLRDLSAKDERDEVNAFLTQVSTPQVKSLLWGALDTETQHYIRQLKAA